METIMEAIYAVDSNYGLSKNGVIPWNSNKDLNFFKNKTITNIVIMGKTNYCSLKGPLKNRLNIVLSRTPEKEMNSSNNVIFTNDDKIYDVIMNNREHYITTYPFLNKDFKIFIIGGKNIYEQFIPLCDYVWMTQMNTNHSCDLFLDYDFSEQFREPEIIDESNELTIYKYKNKNI